MTEIKRSEWQCDECGIVYETQSACQRCEKEHQADVIAITNSEVWLDIGGPGAPSMMGGYPSGHEPEYVRAKVIARKKIDGNWFVLAELSNGERQLVNARELRHVLAEKEYVPLAVNLNGSACTIVT